MTDVRLERHDAVGVTTIDRPEKRNALSPEVMQQLATALDELDRDHEIRCIVIAGSDEVFAAGADIGAMGQGSVQEVVEAAAAALRRPIGACRTPARAGG